MTALVLYRDVLWEYAQYNWFFCCRSVHQMPLVKFVQMLDAKNPKADMQPPLEYFSPLTSSASGGGGERFNMFDEHRFGSATDTEKERQAQRIRAFQNRISPNQVLQRKRRIAEYCHHMVEHRPKHHAATVSPPRTRSLPQQQQQQPLLNSVPIVVWSEGMMEVASPPPPPPGSPMNPLRTSYSTSPRR
jgi:hypothetical protein